MLARAKAMRANPTEWEKRLWRHLSSSPLGGRKFRRQTAIGAAICEFCPARGLVVEVDGSTHDPDDDRRRDLALARRGFRTLRFGEDVRDNREGVLLRILRELQAVPDRWSSRTHPNPSPEGEGL